MKLNLAHFFIFDFFYTQFEVNFAAIFSNQEENSFQVDKNLLKDWTNLIFQKLLVVKNEPDEICRQVIQVRIVFCMALLHEQKPFFVLRFHVTIRNLLHEFADHESPRI